MFVHIRDNTSALLPASDFSIVAGSNQHLEIYPKKTCTTACILVIMVESENIPGARLVLLR